MVSFVITPIRQSVVEGESVNFRISIQNPNYSAVGGAYRIYWRTNNTADDAASGSDFDRVSQLQSILFSATSPQSFTFSIDTHRDNLIEGSEYFEIDLYDFQEHYLAGSATVFTIRDGVADLFINEFDPRNSTVVTGTGVSLDINIGNRGNVSSGPFTSQIYLSTNRTIEPSQDRLLATFSSGSIGAGDDSSGASQSIPLPNVPPGQYWIGILTDTGDAVREGNEENNSISTPLTIVAAQTPAFTDLEILGHNFDRSEGNSGVTPFTFTVARSGNVEGTTTVQWFVTARTSPGATGSDFQGGILPSGTVTFLPSERSQTITVNVLGDTRHETDLPEHFTVKLSAASGGARITRGEAEGLIRNDDAPSWTDLVPISSLSGINQGLTSPTPDGFLFNTLGEPNVGAGTVSPQIRDLIVRDADADPGPSFIRVDGLHQAVESLREVFAEVAQSVPGLLAELTSNGMLVVRYVANTTIPSTHSWGIAIDLNVDGQSDQVGDGLIFRGLAELIPIFNRHGWYSGATFPLEDSMHFEASVELIRSWSTTSVSVQSPQLGRVSATPDKTTLQVTAAQMSASDLRVSADGRDVVVTSVASGTELVRAVGYAALEFVGSQGRDAVALGPLAGTDISNNTIHFLGMAGEDVLDGNATDRRIVAFGGEGGDQLRGGAEADELHGDGGADTITGGGGVDVVYAGAGDDRLQGDAGQDLFFGEAGDDTYVIGRAADSPAAEPDAVYDFESGHDRVDFRGLYGPQIRIVLQIQDGFTQLSFDTERDGVWDAGFLAVGTPIQGGDLIISPQGGPAVGIEYFGSGAADTLNGGAGPDNVLGREGDDRLFGGAGADTLSGEAGTNYVRGDEGNDRLAGGDDFDDLNGNMGDDTVTGGLGADWVVGGKDNDQLFGEAANDIVYGNLGDDTCVGGEGADLIRGGQQNDILYGEAGDDWLSGDRGSDTLVGGAGADIFNFFEGAGIDCVSDFSPAQGDRVRLEGGVGYTIAERDGNTVISLASGDELILVGVTAAAFSAGWIVS